MHTEQTTNFNEPRRTPDVRLSFTIQNLIEENMLATERDGNREFGTSFIPCCDEELCAATYYYNETLDITCVEPHCRVHARYIFTPDFHVNIQDETLRDELTIVSDSCTSDAEAQETDNDEEEEESDDEHEEDNDEPSARAEQHRAYGYRWNQNF
jgi:hypothetical protein